MSKKKEATETGTEIATLTSLFGDKNVMPAMPADLPEGMGNEEVTGSDVLIPQIKLLQGLSPELDDYKEARAGLFFNTRTKTVHEDLIVANLKFKKNFPVFKKRNLGGGMNGSFETEQAALAHITTLPGNTSDYEVTETHMHVLMLLDPQTGLCVSPAIYYMQGTARQSSRDWNSSLQDTNQNGARFISAWRITSVKRSKNGNNWYVPAFEHIGWLQDLPLAECRAFFTNTLAANDSTYAEADAA